jgi:hypothetical protein
VTGGGGNDIIEGGSGADAMDGGAGQDIFVYRVTNATDLANLANLGGDIITGFKSGEDRIDLSVLLSDFDIDSTNLVGQGFLKLEVVGGDTRLLFDVDGGGNGFRDARHAPGRHQRKHRRHHCAVRSDRLLKTGGRPPHSRPPSPRHAYRSRHPRDSAQTFVDGRISFDRDGVLIPTPESLSLGTCGARC